MLLTQFSQLRRMRMRTCISIYSSATLIEYGKYTITETVECPVRAVLFSRTECHLPLASQHTVAADVSRSCKSCPGPLHRRERAYAGSRNMKVDRTGALHNSHLCTRCLRVRHLANGFNSRRRQTSLRAPPDCRGGSVWVGSALKKV